MTSTGLLCTRLSMSITGFIAKFHPHPTPPPQPNPTNLPASTHSLLTPHPQLNAQDEAGVMVGNWSANYDLGTSPMHWEGSTHILREYASTGVPVRFAQCWVFAGVFTTCE